jgi:transposase
VKHIPLVLRERVHELKKIGYTQNHIAEALGISRSSVARILQRQPTDLGRRPGSGFKGLIHEKELECLREFYQKNPNARLREFAAELASRCQVQVSLTTVSNHLNRMGLKRKQKQR